MDQRKPGMPEDRGGVRLGKTSSTSSDLLGGERLTVQAIEERLRAKTGDEPDFSTHRSRKRRRKEERGSGLQLWFSIAVVVALYIAALGYHTLKTRHLPPPAPPATPVEQPVPAPVAVLTLPYMPTASSGEASVTNLIAGIERAQQLAEDGRKLIRNRQFAAAEAKLSAAAMFAPNMMDILMELAGVQLEQKNDLAARDVLLKAISINPGSLNARLLLAKTYFQLRELDNALAMAQWTLEAEPYSAEAHQIAADVYTLTGRDEMALPHWNKIANLNSSNFAARNSLGAALMRLGRDAQAISTFEAIIRNDPGNSQAHYYLSICFIRKNQPDLAIGILSSAANRLGIQFVKAWTKSSDFDPLRGNPAFQKAFEDSQEVIVTPPAPTTTEPTSAVLDSENAPVEGSGDEIMATPIQVAKPDVAPGPDADEAAVPADDATDDAVDAADVPETSEAVETADEAAAATTP